MAEQDTTGNPVFDYRARFRTTAARVQYGLLLGGVLLCVAAGAACLPITLVLPIRACAGWMAAAAGCLIVAGIAWGFYWRRMIRAEFRQTYGPTK